MITNSELLKSSFDIQKAIDNGEPKNRIIGSLKTVIGEICSVATKKNIYIVEVEKNYNVKLEQLESALYLARVFTGPCPNILIDQDTGDPYDGIIELISKSAREIKNNTKVSLSPNSNDPREFIYFIWYRQSIWLAQFISVLTERFDIAFDVVKVVFNDSHVPPKGF